MRNFIHGPYHVWVNAGNPWPPPLLRLCKPSGIPSSILPVSFFHFSCSVYLDFLYITLSLKTLTYTNLKKKLSKIFNKKKVLNAQNRILDVTPHPGRTEGHIQYDINKAAFYAVSMMTLQRLRPTCYSTVINITHWGKNFSTVTLYMVTILILIIKMMVTLLF